MNFETFMRPLRHVQRRNSMTRSEVSPLLGLAPSGFPSPPASPLTERNHSDQKHFALTKRRLRYRLPVAVCLFLIIIAATALLYSSTSSAVNFAGAPQGLCSTFDRQKGLLQHGSPIMGGGPDRDTAKPSDPTKYNATFTPPLRAQGRYILDANDVRFKLASINWYGASDELFVPGGLDVTHRSNIAATIRRMGFNSVRMPYSDEMVRTNPCIPAPLLSANPDLIGMRAMDVLEASVTALTDAGIAVIMNDHITQATWFTGMNLCDATWRNDYLGPVCRVAQTEEMWIENWETVMSRFLHNPLVIGADLRNEVHGFYGTVTWARWAQACERASEWLLAMNPTWLMFVEGTSSANDLSGARKRPVRLSIPGRVVYSSHVYSWSGWGERAPFSSRPYPSFAQKMYENWGYLLDEDIAPVWVGEFGVGAHPREGDRHYWDNLMRYLNEVDADWGYWAINPRKPRLNENESYSLVHDDWKTAVPNDFRLKDLRQIAEPRWTGKGMVIDENDAAQTSAGAKTPAGIAKIM